MPTTTSPALERAFATSPREPSQAPRFTVLAVSEHGTIDHDFVDLDCALKKMRELLVLGISYVTITRSKATS